MPVHFNVDARQKSKEHLRFCHIKTRADLLHLDLIINRPFVPTKGPGQFGVICTGVGGGLSGPAGAVRHGISKAPTC
ncbi:MAG: 30S ribosomal protein S9 [Stellaceae bacterium]